MTTGQELHKLRWIYDGASMPSGGKAEVESSYMSRAASADPVSAALAPGNVSVMQGDAEPGTLPPNVASSGRMAPAVSEAALYAQLTHFVRLLDPTLAIARCKDDEERLQAQR